MSNILFGTLAVVLIVAVILQGVLVSHWLGGWAFPVNLIMGFAEGTLAFYLLRRWIIRRTRQQPGDHT